MEIGIYIFAAILVAVGVFLILQVRGAEQGEAPPDASREQQWIAYEQRVMRLRRDKVWWRIETLYSEFNEREAGGSTTPQAQAPAPRPEQGGDDPDAALLRELRAAYEQFASQPARPQTDRRTQSDAP